VVVGAEPNAIALGLVRHRDRLNRGLPAREGESGLHVLSVGGARERTGLQPEPVAGLGPRGLGAARDFGRPLGGSLAALVDAAPIGLRFLAARKNLVEIEAWLLGSRSCPEVGPCIACGFLCTTGRGKRRREAAAAEEIGDR